MLCKNNILDHFRIISDEWELVKLGIHLAWLNHKNINATLQDEFPHPLSLQVSNPPYGIFNWKDVKAYKSGGVVILDCLAVAEGLQDGVGS